MKSTLLFLSVFLSVSLFGQNVFIPDANFKAYLVGNTNINTNGDSEIQVSEASAFTGEISCIGESISDLTGIEAFTALTELDCGINNLSSLDLFNNAALEVLYCDNNQLTSLDVSSNTALTQLYCLENNLTSLDVSNNTSLLGLNCNYNQLISLDVNTALTELGCGINNLSSLDLSQNTNLTLLYCADNQLTCLNLANGNNTNILQGYFVATNNPDLTCIEVDDVNYSTANWTDIDSQTSFSIDCDDDCDDPTVGINELTTTKSLIQTLDMMGRETTFKPNTPIIYVYDDGSIEKVFSVEY